MFAVILTERESRKFRKRKTEIEAVQTSVRGGAPFRIVTISKGRKDVDWHRVAELASCASRNLLVPDGFILPDSPYLKLFEADTLPLLITLNTAAKKLKALPGATKRSLLIEDKNAVLSDYIDRVAACAAKIKIVTDKPQDYYNAGLRLMERFGASPIVCGEINENEKFDAAVSQKPLINASLNFSVSQIKADGSPEIPEQYARLCPTGIDRFDFMCALFECSGVKAIGEYTLYDLISSKKNDII
ncbi:MAG: hypothetical protein IKK49_04195 [Clostridia bacterium]|nr:hypothetical protein [Clostridia bacterium]